MDLSCSLVSSDKTCQLYKSISLHSEIRREMVLSLGGSIVPFLLVLVAYEYSIRSMGRILFGFNPVIVDEGRGKTPVGDGVGQIFHRHGHGGTAAVAQGFEAG